MAEIPSGTPSPSERPCERHDEVRDFGGQRIGAGPCVDRDGRTVRHSAYVFPSSGNPVVRWSVLAGALVPMFLIGLYFLGTPARPDRGGLALRTALSPGATFSRHSMASLDCTQCHRAGHPVEDARCERCHDVPLSARLSNAAHVFQGTGDTVAALAAPTVPCATCHVEHRGAGVHLADVDDRECGTCHRATSGGITRLTALTRHPEFAMVREGAETASGLRWFNHQIHVPKVQAKFQKTCNYCHERSPDSAAFAAISFPRHCAKCHEADLADSAATLPRATIAALGPLPGALRTRPDFDDPALLGLTGFTHADPWVLSTVQALRATIDPAGAAAERAMLDRQVAQLELRQTFGASGPAYGAWTGLEPGLRVSAAQDRLTATDERIGAAARAVAAFVSTLSPQDANTAAILAEAARLEQVAPATVQAAGAPAPGIEPLRQLLQATIARANAAGDDSVKKRATDLIARLDALVAQGTRPTMPAAPPTGFTALLRDLAMAADPRVRADAWRLNDLAEMAQRQARGGIDLLAFDLHRQQTLRLLDQTQQALLAQRQTTGAAEADTLLARVSALRQRVLATGYGTSPAVAAARAAFFQTRQIERARVDTELDAAGLRLAAPAEAADAWQEPLEPRLAQLRRQLAAIAARSTLAAALSPADARRAIAALLGKEAADADDNQSGKNRCTYCHELAPGGDQLAPLPVAGASLLVKARFTHAPHVTGDIANCETCHTKILASTNARDLNLPAVASCIVCHAPGKQAARATGCESCHKYHVPSRTAMVWTP